ncbi:hypothetical protein PO124_28040 [Bacillus licheniformis]|nr:hypothetical protein [Bacillus licheniformis]
MPFSRWHGVLYKLKGETDMTSNRNSSKHGEVITWKMTEEQRQAYIKNIPSCRVMSIEVLGLGRRKEGAAGMKEYEISLSNEREFTEMMRDRVGWMVSMKQITTSL